MSPFKPSRNQPAIVVHLDESLDETAHLILEAQAGSIDAQNAIVLNWLPYCKKVSRKTAERHNRLDLLDDLVQTSICGTEKHPSGIIQAIKKFNPAIGTKFSTYATHWINEALSNYILREQVAVKSPRLAKLDSRIRRIKTEVEEFLGRPGNVDEIKKAFGGTTGERLTLNAILRAEQDTSWEDLNEEHGASEDDVVDYVQRKELYDSIQSLTPRLKRIMLKRFVNGETRKDVAVSMSLTVERIRQLENDALRILKEKLQDGNV